MREIDHADCLPIRVRALLSLTAVLFVPILVKAAEPEKPIKKGLEPVNDWTISGKLIVPEGEKLPKPEDINWQVVRYGKIRNEFCKGNGLGYPEQEPILEVGQDGTFHIKNNPKFPDHIFKGSFVLGMYWKKNGALAESAKFTVSSDPARIEDLVLKFGPPGERVLRLRVLDPETGKGLPKVELEAELSPESFSNPGLSELKVATATTDENGFLRLEHLPEGKIKLRTDRDYGLAMTDWIGVNTEVRLPTLLATEAAKLSNEQLPTLYRSPKGKGMYWDALLIDVREDGPNSQQLGFKRLAKGTVLEFKAKRAAELNKSEHWDPKLTFRVTVGEQSLVKTPLVPNGDYAVKSVSGTPYEGEVGIRGMGNTSNPPLHETLKSKYMLDNP